MDRIYLDNSATSFPKPEAVTEAMVRFAHECGASAGRGAYAEAKACEQIIATCRARVAELIGAEAPERIVFAMNCSEGLAIVIRGLLNTAPRGTHEEASHGQRQPLATRRQHRVAAARAAQLTAAAFDHAHTQGRCRGHRAVEDPVPEKGRKRCSGT